MRHDFGDLFALRPSPPRFGVAARTAVSAAIPILIGVAAHDVGAGLIATLGAFTARFGGDRPYLSRAGQLALIAVALAAAVTFGAWAAPVAWQAIAAVTLVALLAVWLCAALVVGPPGAYIFVLVCAAGVGISGSHLPPWHIGLLVLAGGAVSWAVQMLPALGDVRRPEKQAVAAAGAAVAAYLDSPDSDTRRAAAQALHRGWAALVTYQPRGAQLEQLRLANHALHVLFTDAVRGGATSAELAEQAREIGTLRRVPDLARPVRPALRPPAIRARLAEAVRPGSQTSWILRRVAVAVPLAGIAAATLGLGHIYWAMAAAVLVLHLGADRTATLVRGAQRLLGTWAGLALAAVPLTLHPQGLWLAVVVPALQFLIQILVARNYLLATVVITATALTISAGAREVQVGPLLLDRGLDTLIGCAVGVAVYLCSVGRQESGRLSAALRECLTKTAEAAEDPADRTRRRTLQLSIIALGTAFDAAAAGPRAHRDEAARLARAVAAAEHLGYLTVATCWATEHGGDGTVGDSRYLAVLRGLATGTAVDLAGVPEVLRADVTAVAQASA